MFVKISYRAETKITKMQTNNTIATFNVRTLNKIGQLPELTASTIDHSIDIICIQEHRYTPSEDISYHDSGTGWTLATASAWKNSVNSTVGILIGPRALKSVNSIERIQPWMMVGTFNGNTRATIISCYSPTIPMLVKKLGSSTSMRSYPLLFVATQNTTFLSYVET